MVYIHADTRDKFEGILRIFEEKGWSWQTGAGATTKFELWDKHEENTVIKYQNGMSYGEYEEIKNQEDDSIMSFPEFIEREVERRFANAEVGDTLVRPSSSNEKLDNTNFEYQSGHRNAYLAGWTIFMCDTGWYGSLEKKTCSIDVGDDITFKIDGSSLNYRVARSDSFDRCYYITQGGYNEQVFKNLNIGDKYDWCRTHTSDVKGDGSFPYITSLEGLEKVVEALHAACKEFSERRKFKRNDRVQLQESSQYHPNQSEGGHGTVTELKTPGYGFDYEVQWDTGRSFSYNECDIEEAKWKPKFKVGDKVAHTDESDYICQSDGTIGEVIDNDYSTYYDEDSHVYRVSFTNGRTDSYREKDLRECKVIDFTIGDWYYSHSETFKVERIEGGRVYYGTNHGEEFGITSQFAQKAQPAERHQIETRILQMCYDKGFAEGVEYKNLDGDTHIATRSPYVCHWDWDEPYVAVKDGGGLIYRKGEFGSIVEQKGKKEPGIWITLEGTVIGSAKPVDLGLTKDKRGFVVPKEEEIKVLRRKKRISK